MVDDLTSVPTGCVVPEVGGAMLFSDNQLHRGYALPWHWNTKIEDNRGHLFSRIGVFPVTESMKF